MNLGWRSCTLTLSNRRLGSILTRVVPSNLCKFNTMEKLHKKCLSVKLLYHISNFCQSKQWYAIIDTCSAKTLIVNRNVYIHSSSFQLNIPDVDFQCYPSPPLSDTASSTFPVSKWYTLLAVLCLSYSIHKWTASDQAHYA